VLRTLLTTSRQLLLFFQSCNHLFCFSSMWKVAIIWPVAKVNTPSGPSDFRPISIVSVLSKAFVRIFYDQVLDHVNIVNGRNLLSDYQSGFRRGHSTVTVLVRVSEDIRSVKAGGKVTLHVLLYFSKVFDFINHWLFVHKLGSWYDFHTSAMGMVSSFLRDRSMVVEVDGVKSAPLYLSSGLWSSTGMYPIFAVFFYVYQHLQILSCLSYLLSFRARFLIYFFVCQGFLLPQLYKYFL
jgi:hypothetical protein